MPKWPRISIKKIDKNLYQCEVAYINVYDYNQTFANESNFSIYEIKNVGGGNLCVYIWCFYYGPFCNDKKNLNE